MNAFMRGFLDELEKRGARVYLQGKKDLFEAKGPKGKTRAFVNYIPDKSEKEIFHQPDVRRNIADVIRTFRKDPKAGKATLATPTSKREVALSSTQAIKVLRKRGKHFARGPAGKMEALRFRLEKNAKTSGFLDELKRVEKTGKTGKTAVPYWKRMDSEQIADMRAKKMERGVKRHRRLFPDKHKFVERALDAAAEWQKRQHAESAKMSEREMGHRLRAHKAKVRGKDIRIKSPYHTARGHRLSGAPVESWALHPKVLGKKPVTPWGKWKGVMKGAFAKEAFVRGFFDELEKRSGIFRDMGKSLGKGIKKHGPGVARAGGKGVLSVLERTGGAAVGALKGAAKGAVAPEKV